MRNLHPCCHVALFISPWTYIEWIILSTQLLRSHCVEISLWWAFTRDTNIFTTEPIWRGLSKYLFFSPSCHQISNCVPSKSLTKPLAMAMNEYGSKPLAIFPSKQDKHPRTQSSAHWDIPSPLSFRGVPEWSNSAKVRPSPTDLSPRALRMWFLINS